MSGPALRAPAPAGRIARHYLALLARGSTAAGVALALLLPLALQSGWGPFGMAPDWLVLMLFLPLLHWRGAGRPGPLDAALPMGRTRHALLRVAGGAAWALLTMLPAVAFFVFKVETRDRGVFPEAPYPAWYPLAVLVMGITLYLFGSAAWLRAARPAAWLVGSLLLGVPAAVLLLPGWLTEGMFAAFATPEGMGHRTAAQWLAGAAVGLAAACASVVWAAASRRADAPSGRSGWRPRPSAAPPLPGTGAVPRLPAGPSAALRRHAALLGRRMGLAALVTASVLFLLASRPGMDPSLPGFSAALALLVIAYLWPLLVWMDEGGRAREHEEALPVARETDRLARVAVGGAWLAGLVLLVLGALAGAAWAAGTISSPAAVPARIWAGVPGAALCLYLLGTLPVLLAPRSRVLWSLAWYALLVHPAGPVLLGAPSLRLRDALSPITHLDASAPWAGALLAWLPLLAALAWLAAALSAALRRHGAWRPATPG